MFKFRSSLALAPIFMALIFMVALPLTARAQYLGPSTQSYNTVAQALADAQNINQVRLKGYIKEQTGNQTYIFADDTGEITATINEDIFQNKINNNTLVEIEGELETFTLSTPTITVYNIMLLENPAH